MFRLSVVTTALVGALGVGVGCFDCVGVARGDSKVVPCPLLLGVGVEVGGGGVVACGEGVGVGGWEVTTTSSAEVGVKVGLGVLVKVGVAVGGRLAIKGALTHPSINISITPITIKLTQERLIILPLCFIIVFCKGPYKGGAIPQVN